MKIRRTQPKKKDRYCVPIKSEVTGLTQFHNVWAVSPEQAANFVRHRLFPGMSYDDIYRDHHLIFKEAEVVPKLPRSVPSARQMELF